MKNLIKGAGALALALSLVLFPACVSSNAGSGVKAGQTSIRYSVNGTRLDVFIDGNPTTGYVWTCETSDSSVLDCASEGYQENPHTPGIVGVGGVFIFHLESAGTGRAVLTFNYARSWEPEPIETKTIEAKVGKDGTITVLSVSGTAPRLP